MNIKNFVIDRVIDGVAETSNGIVFRINQITNPSLSCTSESADAVDALGVPITTFYRAKQAEFSGENALFDLDLAAVQFGGEKSVASDDKKIVVPRYTIITVIDGVTNYSLNPAPIKPIEYIYTLTNADGINEKYTKGAAASGKEFLYDAENHSITLPDTITAGTELFIKYEYESSIANVVSNSANKFPEAFKFTLRVLGCDVCDPTTLRVAYIVFANAKLSPNVDLNFTTDGTHNFLIKCQVDYCDKEKKLFSIVVDEKN